MKMIFIVVSAIPRLILLFFIFGGIESSEAIGAQTQSLSRITPQQITKILQLPATVTIYEPPAECDDPKNSRCYGMDQVKKLITVSDDGKPQLNECGEMRLFRFAGLKYLNLVAGICHQGRLTLPELSETKTQALAVTERFLKEATSLTNSPLTRLRHTLVLALNDGETVHIFTALLVAGHGLSFLPTAVVTGPRTRDTFVLQLFIVPETGGFLVDDLVPKVNEVMESLVKEIYPTIR